MKTFLFVDLETTGLDVEQGKILEVGWVVTNETFDPLSTNTRVVFHPPDVTELMEDVVLEMHTTNGLLDEISNGVPLSHALSELADDAMRRADDRGGELYLAGYSVHFDRDWMKKHKKVSRPVKELLCSYVSHRLLDLSAVKLCLTPEQKRVIDRLHPLCGQSVAHRALQDAEHARLWAQTARQHLKVVL